MSARGITIVGASAGSGKTYRLTQDVTNAVSTATGERVPLEGLVAVTYTRKAHAELAARIRQKLVGAGAFDEAMRLPLAYLGTVHAACLRLLQEFALDVGLSPHVDVVADDQARLLRQSLDTTLPIELHARLDRLSNRFELRLDPKIHRIDWLTPVGDIMDLSRANRIAAADLPAMAKRSADGVLGLLRTPEKDGAALDAALAAELPRALLALSKKSDVTDVTSKAVDLLRAAMQRLEDDELPWSDWAKLATVRTSVACQDVVAPLREIAVRYEAHPRLHEELRALTSAIFEAAATGLSGYQAWKEQRRVVDYVDMLDRALTLLGTPRVRDELAGRLKLAVVDEFQDTSPIQLALFVELQKLAGRSIWVGDRKQCIFEYAGADPLLMDAVSAWVAKDGGTLDRLVTNYRSRPELVSACTELFAGALARHGFTREEIAVGAHRSNAGLEALPPFGLFRIEGANKEEAAEAIAEGVRRLIASSEETPVVDRVTKQARPVRPGDIAILVATNAEADLIAAALHARGTRAALAREGLLSTPEGTIADSALRWLIDERDSLAAATVDALTGFGGKDGEAWLSDRLLQPPPDAEPEAPCGWRAALALVRESLGLLSPSEALDRALAALDVVGLCARWPDPAQRIANIDALRGLAAGYETRCTEEREAGTVAGLLRHFDAIRAKTIHRDEMLAADHQHVPSDDDAVTVCTYHKAKGLEWPVVIMGSLDRAERRDAFEVSPESDRADFDPLQPLQGRWIRYWPWPFGRIEKVPLRDVAAQSDEGRRVAAREDKERARLLYVGFTRARDHLVLAVRVKVTKRSTSQQTDWLDALSDEKGTPLLELPLKGADGGTATMRIHAGSGKVCDVPTRVWHTAPKDPERHANSAAPRWFSRAAESRETRPPYRIVPSAAQLGWPELESALASATLGAAERLPTAIRLDEKGIDHEVLGNAVHAFLGADVEGLSEADRLERARRLLAGVGMTGFVRAEALVTAGDTLRAWVSAKWPDAVWWREVPIDAVVESRHGTRRVSGIIDLLLETRAGCVILDHKTFPGSTEAAWRAKCSGFVPQLATYAELVSRVEGKHVAACWVHLPVGGGMLEVRRCPLVRPDAAGAFEMT